MIRSLASDIHDAFRDAEPPPAGAISVPSYDDEGTQDHFGGTRWQDHSARTLENYTFSLEAFTSEGFAYYLPAFLLAALEGTAPGVKDSIVAKLCPPKNNPMRPSYMSWWRLLKPEQRTVVVQFLKQLAPDNPHHLEAAAGSLETKIVV